MLGACPGSDPFSGRERPLHPLRCSSGTSPANGSSTLSQGGCTHVPGAMRMVSPGLAAATAAPMLPPRSTVRPSAAWVALGVWLEPAAATPRASRHCRRPECSSTGRGGRPPPPSPSRATTRSPHDDDDAVDTTEGCGGGRRKTELLDCHPQVVRTDVPARALAIKQWGIKLCATLLWAAGMRCRPSHSALVLVLALMVVNGADAARAARQRVPRSVVRSPPSPASPQVVLAAPCAAAGVLRCT